MKILSKIGFASAIVAGTVLLPTAAHAWFDVCNNSRQTVAVAFAYLNVDDPRDCAKELFAGNPRCGNRNNPTLWTSEGLWVLGSGQCTRVYQPELRTRNQYYYVWAAGQKAPASVWQGNHRFCIQQHGKFRLGGAANTCGGSDRVWKNFIQVDVGNARNFTFNLQ